MLGKIVSGIGNFIGGVSQAVGAISGISAEKRNYELQKDQLEWQKGEWQWQKDMHQLTMDREDNAIQRRMADLEKAGVNPLTAVGTPGASATSGPSAPKLDAPQRDARQLQESISKLIPIQYMQEIAKTRAETERIRTETNKEKLGNRVLELDIKHYGDKIEKVIWETKLAQNKYEIDKRELRILAGDIHEQSFYHRDEWSKKWNFIKAYMEEIGFTEWMRRKLGIGKWAPEALDEAFQDWKQANEDWLEQENPTLGEINNEFLNELLYDPEKEIKKKHPNLKKPEGLGDFNVRSWR